MNKSELRQKYHTRKIALSTGKVAQMSNQIFKTYLDYFSLERGDKVHCFLSITEKNEVDTRPFLDYFFAHEIRVFVPKVAGSEFISVEITRETPLIKSAWGIAEPACEEDAGVTDFDMILLPLLYADANGNRVGYGKGFYDKFLAKLPNPPLKVGLSFFPPNETVSDISPLDIPLDYLVTPAEVLSFINSTSKPMK